MDVDLTIGRLRIPHWVEQFFLMVRALIWGHKSIPLQSQTLNRFNLKATGSSNFKRQIASIRFGAFNVKALRCSVMNLTSACAPNLVPRIRLQTLRQNLILLTSFASGASGLADLLGRLGWVTAALFVHALRHVVGLPDIFSSGPLLLASDPYGDC